MRARTDRGIFGHSLPGVEADKSDDYTPTPHSLSLPHARERAIINNILLNFPRALRHIKPERRRNHCLTDIRYLILIERLRRRDVCCSIPLPGSNMQCKYMRRDSWRRTSISTPYFSASSTRNSELLAALQQQNYRCTFLRAILRHFFQIAIIAHRRARG